MTKKVLHIQKERGVRGRGLLRRKEEEQQQQEQQGNSMRRLVVPVLIVLCSILLLHSSSTNLSYVSSAVYLIYNLDNDDKVDTVTVQNVALATLTDLNLTELGGRGGSFNYGPSQLAGDVEKIIHIPSKHQIVIHLKDEQRKCSNPRFFGRLSGPYITAIQWEQESSSSKSTTTESTTDIIEDNIVTNVSSTTTMMPMAMSVSIKLITGHYSVPSPGRYFIEVISLLCNDLSFETNFKKVCLEDPTSHRITNSTAFIDVVATTAAELVVVPPHQHDIKKDSPPLGHWKWSLPDVQEEALFTRYQPIGCGLQDVSPRCQVPMSRARFSPYEFVYNNNNNNGNNDSNNEDNNSEKITFTEENIRNKAQKILAEQQQRKENGGKIVLCFIGISHAREMAHHVNLWLNDEWKVSQAIVVRYIKAALPRHVNFQQIKNNQCSKTIIANGQWAIGKLPNGVSYKNVSPIQFPNFQAEVAAMISYLQTNGTENIYLRSIHYNSFGHFKLTCPPTDWRTPPVIDRYNDILQNVSSTMNVPYIDTNFIIQPMWDSAEDFCHYRRDKTAAAEALYMTGKLIFDY